MISQLSLIISLLLFIVQLTISQRCALLCLDNVFGLVSKDETCVKFDIAPKSFRDRLDMKHDPKQIFDRVYHNIPIMSGAYCFNNNSGLCKGFSGKFEYYFNTYTDKFLGPVGKSDYVDQYGYHKRVPVSYTVYGQINYADRSINWARKYRREHSGELKNLLSTSSINWCEFVDHNYWPYRSSFIYKPVVKTKPQRVGTVPEKEYHVYFFNRQTCIYDTATKRTQHFNTRYLYKSNLRIDLDMNPLIFTMQDNMTKPPGQILLVKHKRQHWHEQTFTVVENYANVSYFILMEENVSGGHCKLCGNNKKAAIVLTKKAYDTTYCMSDYFHVNPENGNAGLVPSGCGTELAETADYPYPSVRKGLVHEAGLHNIPRHPRDTEFYFGVKIKNDAHWKRFASDGIVFTAITSIPIVRGNKKMTNETRVISLFALFNAPQSAAANKQDSYPTPYISDYIARYNEQNSHWDVGSVVRERTKNQKKHTNLNHVDDIAYLHKCGTILVVFGPFYSEMKPDKFNLEAKTDFDSIYNLGMWELPNAFFAVADTNALWVYYRANFVAELTYTCKSSLVTATQKDGKYYPKIGRTTTPAFPGIKIYDYVFVDENYTGEILSPDCHDNTETHYEETFFEDLQLFKGKLDHKAPDPARFPLEVPPAAKPEDDTDSTWTYVFIAIGVILILVMCVICLLTMRRRRLHHQQPQMSNMTARSPLSTMSRPGSTVRDPLKTSYSPSRTSSRGTRRSSALSSGRPSGTVRSSVTGKSRSGSTKTSRSSNLSSRSSRAPSARSGIKMSSLGSNSRSTASRRK